MVDGDTGKANKERVLDDLPSISRKGASNSQIRKATRIDVNLCQVGIDYPIRVEAIGVEPLTREVLPFTAW